METAASAVTAALVVGLLVFLPLPHVQRHAAVEAALVATTDYSIDSACIGAKTTILHWHPQPKIEPARGAALVVSGWAVDTAEHAPVRSVSAVVDGEQTFAAAIGFPRPDVAAKFANPAYATPGFRVTIPACTLSPGPHRIALRFEGADGRGFYRSNDDVDIDVGTASSAPVAYAVDAVAPAPTQPGRHEARGWLVDARSCAPARGLRVTLDGRTVARAHYGSARPDVATVLGVAAYANSGFTATWSDAALARGPHVLRLVAVLPRAGAASGSDEDVDAGFVLRFVR